MTRILDIPRDRPRPNRLLMPLVALLAVLFLMALEAQRAERHEDVATGLQLHQR